jgi:hypothetical protein
MFTRQFFYCMVLGFCSTAILLVGCGGGSSRQSSAVQSVVKFSSQPGTAANEGDAYSYTLSATDTANGAISFAISTAPEGATLAGAELTWTPTSAQSRIANSFTVSAESSAGGSAQQTWSVNPTGVIHGQQIVTWRLQGGALYALVPSDLTSVPISAVVPTGGDFLTLPGVGAVDGSFTIAKVPAGHYWLQFGNDYFWTGKSQVDLGFDCLGRPEAAWAQALTRHLNVAGLNPWQNTDYLEWYSANLASDIRVPVGLASLETLLDFPWIYTGTMLDASKGDTAYLAQMTSVPFGSIVTNNLNKIYQVSGVTEIDGQINEIGGSGANFRDVPMTETIEGNVKGASFAAMRPALNPNFTASGTGFDLEVLPFGSSKGWFGPSPGLISYWGPPLDVDEDDGPLSYGNPFDASWPLVFTFADSVTVAYTVPAVGVVPKFGYTFLNTVTMPTASQPIAPLIGPVTAPQINGVSFFQDQFLNGLTPTVSWNAPTVGTPTEYTITICKWETVAGNDYTCGQYASFIAGFHTKATSFQVPSGILESGQIYFLNIGSRLTAGIDIESSPYRMAFPQAGAESLSGLIGFAGNTSNSLRARYKKLSKSLNEQIAPPAIRISHKRR